MSERRVLLGYAVDIFGPLFAWWVTQALGISVLWGLGMGVAIALVSAGINTFRRGKMDAVGVLVLVEMTASIAFLFWFHSPQILLIRPSFYSGIAAFYLMGSAFTSHPLSLEWSKPMATKGDPVRTVAWDTAWQQLAQFRKAHRLLTFGSGVALLMDAVVRVLIVCRFPAARAAWLAQLPHIAAVAIFIGVGALFGRWAGPLVDRVQQELAAPAG
jgi:hypothetical protein